MRKYALIILIGFFYSVHSQNSIEFTPIFGFTLNGNVDTFNSEFNISNDISYGGLVTVMLSDYMGLELSYKRSNNEVREFFFPTATQFRYDAGIEHYQIGFQRVFSTEEFQPFALGSLGASRYFRRDNKNDILAFSMTFGGGIKYFFNDNFGLRLQSNLILPMEFGGAGFFCGIGSAGGSCGTTASFYVPTVHWESSIGLIYRMN